MIFISTLVYSVLNPINVNSTLTGTCRGTVEGEEAKQNREMYLSGLLEALCISNVNPTGRGDKYPLERHTFIIITLVAFDKLT